MARKTITKKDTKETPKTSSKKARKIATSSRFSAMSTSSIAENKGGTEAEQAIGGTSVKVRRSTIVIALCIILLAALLYFGRGFIVAAVVNGQPISRLALVQEAERQSGKQAMATLIRNALIEQEARKANVTISDKEVNDQIKTIENNLSKQGQNIDQMLTLEGMTRDDLRRIIRLDLTVSKIVGKDIKISDKDVADYIEKNKDSLPKDQNASQLKQTVIERLKQEQLPQKAQAWISSLEKKSKVIKFVNY
jgi:foldase protein PrsA